MIEIRNADPYRGRNYPYNEPDVEILEDRIEREVLVPAEVVPNPSPVRNPGGDCFACATLAIFRALFPGKDITFDDAWQAWQREQDGRTYLANHWDQVGRSFNTLATKLNLRIDDEPHLDYYLPDPHQTSAAYWTSSFAMRERTVEAFLCAGYLLMVQVHKEPAPPIGADGSHNSPDHFVVVNGFRKRYSRTRTRSATAPGGSYESGGWQEYAHVLDSAASGGSYWIDFQTFTRMHGAAGYWLIRSRDDR